MVINSETNFQISMSVWSKKNYYNKKLYNRKENIWPGKMGNIIYLRAIYK